MLYTCWVRELAKVSFNTFISAFLYISLLQIASSWYIACKKNTRSMQNKKRDYEFWIKLGKIVGRCPIDVNICLKRPRKLDKEKNTKRGI
jgi:hypothetical protein